MELVKPFYVNYEKKRKDSIICGIYSIDIHPSGKKYVTSGGNDINGVISIWNMEPLRFKEKESDETCPRLLFTDQSHLKCVNVVRWSPNGKYLASGSVDSTVLIWVQRKLSEMEKVTKKHHESYRRAHNLCGHTNDVQDVAWSPRGEYLCSAGVDGKIVIWNTEKFPEKVTTLTGHTSNVQGVSWDPLGRYLASQADDRTLRIWRTSDWKEEAKFHKEIDKGNPDCIFTRISWSPEGSNIAATATVNKGAPTCQLYSRESWTKGVDMVGHRKHIICAKFFPVLLKLDGQEKDYLLLAVGGKDRALSLWGTFQTRPIIVLSDLFTDTILDISWNSENMELIASSLDGTVVYIRLKTKEFGRPFSKEEMSAYLEKTYGPRLVSEQLPMVKTDWDNFIVPESAALLKIQKQQMELHNHHLKKSSISIAETKKSSGPNEQIVKTTAGGKRRITPKFLNQIDEDDMDQETPVVITKTPQVTETAAAVPVVPDQPESMEVVESEVKSLAESSNSDKMKPVVEDVMSEKIPPKAKVVPEPTLVKPDSPSALKEDYKDLLSNGVTTKKAVISREAIDKDDEEPLLPLKHSFDAANVPSSDPVPKLQLVQNTDKQSLTVSAMKHGSTLLCMMPPDNYVLKINRVDATNNSNDYTGPCKVSVIEKEYKWWEYTTDFAITVVIHYKDYLFMGDMKGQLHHFTLRGGYRTFPYMLCSSVSAMFCDGKNLFVVTRKAKLWVFRFSGPLGIQLIQKESFRLYLTDDGEKSLVKSVSRISAGHIAVVFESGSSLLMIISENSMPIWQTMFDCSIVVHAWTIVDLSCPSHATLPLGSLQKPTTQLQDITNSVSATRRREIVMQTVERQTRLSEVLHSPEEYRYWFLMWLRMLIHNGEENRVRDMCYGLLGPVHSSTRTSWDPYVVTLSKRGLLKEVLPLFSLNLSLQGLYTELKDQLDLIKSRTY